MRSIAFLALGVFVVPLSFPQYAEGGGQKHSHAAGSRGASDNAALEHELRQGQFAEVLAHARQRLSHHPNDVAAWNYVGMAYLHLGRTEEALPAFERAIAIGSDDVRSYLNLALLYAARNDKQKAIDLYERALTLDSTNGGAFYNYGRLLISVGDYVKAATALRRAAEINSTDVEAQLSVVEALLRGGRQAEAWDYARRTLLEPGGVAEKALLALGTLFTRAGEMSRAKLVLDRARALAPRSAEVCVELSRFYVAASQPQDAIAAASNALGLAPDSPVAHLTFAEALISAGSHQEAATFLSENKKLLANIQGFHHTLGVAHLGLREYASAVDSLTRAIEIDPSYDASHFLLGKAYLARGNLNEAQTAFEAAIARNSKSPLYYNYLAQVYEQKGSEFRQAAVDCSQKALALNPREVDARIRLGRWEIAEGNLANARKLLEAVVEDAPKHTPARVLLARVYYKLGLLGMAEEQQVVIRSLQAEAQRQLIEQTRSADR